MRTQGRRATALAVMMTLGLATAGASAAQAADQPLLAVEQDGTAHLGWRQFDGTASVLQGRTRSPAGTLSRSQWLSPAGEPSSSADMAADESGNAVFVWRSHQAPGGLHVRRRTADGGLGPIQDVRTIPAEAPQVALDAEGDAVIVWWRVGSSGGGVVEARRRSAAGVLGPVTTLSPPGLSAHSPSLAVDSAGNALVVWTRYDGSVGRGFIQARSLSAGGTLGTVRDLTADTRDAHTPRVAMDAAGNAFVSWVRHDGTRYVPQLRRRSAGGAYSATQIMSAAGGHTADPRVAVSPAGAAIVAWLRATPTGEILQARHRASDGTLGSTLTLTPEGSGLIASGARVAMDPQGNAVFVWSQYAGGQDIVRTRRRSAGGSVSSAQDVSPSPGAGVQPRVGFDGNGNATFAWMLIDGSDAAIQVRRRTAAGTLTPVQTVSPSPAPSGSR